MSDISKHEFLEYWSYYLYLESKVAETSNYVECCEDNFETYSREYVSLLTLIWSEADNMFKVLCSLLSEPEADSIKDYRKCLNKHYSKDELSKTVISRDGTISFQPLLELINGLRPDWWDAGNDVKHNRIMNYKKANLGNVLKGLAGLYYIELLILPKVNGRKYFDVPYSSAFKVFDDYDYEAHITITANKETIKEFEKVNEDM